MAEIILKVSGMSCQHCKNTVEKALLGLKGVERVQVNLEEGKVAVAGSTSYPQLVKAIEEAGYKVVR